MKLTKRIFSIMAVAGLFAFFMSSCKTQGTTISGTISNAQNMQVFLDKIVMGKASNVLSSSKTDASGNFEISFPEGIDAGIYTFRVGPKKVGLVLDGKETDVKINGDFSTIQNFEFTLSGSSNSLAFQNIMQRLIKRQVSSQDITAFVDTTSNPLMGAYLTYISLGGSSDFLPVYEKAQTKLAEAYPNDDNTREFAKHIALIKNQQSKKVTVNSGPIQVGMPAPDIRMKGPDGKEYALSDLKGKVVLLDFWASWCGPCRRENPHVVKVYDQYKDQGFTVFSVSLDGVDSRTKSRMSNQEQIDQFIQRSKTKWLEAIQKDKLSWEYHVSDLLKWDTPAAKLYGVRGIPKSFLIDREGKISAVGIRGAAQLEQELKKVL